MQCQGLTLKNTQCKKKCKNRFLYCNLHKILKTSDESTDDQSDTNESNMNENNTNESNMNKNDTNESNMNENNTNDINKTNKSCYDVIDDSMELIKYEWGDLGPHKENSKSENDEWDKLKNICDKAKCKINYNNCIIAGGIVLAVIGLSLGLRRYRN